MASAELGPRWGYTLTTEERRAEIMRSLSGILRERNISSLTMKDVADRLGMTKGNLYYYFKSKEDLLYQCHMKFMADSLRVLDECERIKGPASTRLRALVKGIVLHVIEDPYGSVLVTVLEQLTPAHRKKYLAHRDTFTLAVRKLIDDGVAAGEFAVTDTKMASFVLLGAINSISRWYHPAGEHSPEYIAEAFTDLLLRGLSA